mgnify:CR=1 FL=1
MTTHITDGDRSGDGGEQINDNNETHRETAETAKLLQEDKLAQVVHR